MATLDRRSLVTTLSVSAIGAAIGTRPASAQTPSASPVTGEWTWTDVTGTTVTLPQRPVRIAAVINVVAGLWDLGVRATAIFGWSAANYPDGDHISWGNVDPSAVVQVGNDDQTMNVEALVAARPDIIVTVRYTNDDLSVLDSMTPDDYATFQQIAPVIVLNQVDDQATEVQRVVDFAASLGVDVNAPEIAAKRKAWYGKLEELQALSIAKPDLTALFASFDPDALWVAGPNAIGELKTLQDNGLTFVNGDSPMASEYWEELSIEAANTYPADVAYIDVYSTLQTAEELREHPSYGAIPAVESGQVGEWLRDSPLTYDAQATFVETVLAPLRTAEKVS
jgi:iron complex transport system substrate-binding protein